MSDSSSSCNLPPTHVCPECGEWWDVERGGPDLWIVSVFRSEITPCSTTWTMAAGEPLCPKDATGLHAFMITDG